MLNTTEKEEVRKLAQRLQALESILIEERKQARYALEQFMNPDLLVDPALRVWAQAAHVYSGDIVLAARTPANVLHLMLIDNMSQGTGSTVNALPVIAPFYRMTEKGFSIDAIVRESNARIFRFTPEGQSVPATLISVDFSDGVIHVWNGGTPSPIMLNPQTGTVLAAVPRAELGAVSPERFHVETDVWTFQDESLLAIASRGFVHELTPPEGGAAAEVLSQWLLRQGDLRFEALRETDLLDCTKSGTDSNEDRSLTLVQCVRDSKALQTSGTISPRHVSRGEWRLSLSISPEEMRSVDVVPLLLGVIGQFDTTREMAGTLFVVLSELYNNALDHGVLGLDSSLKLGPDGMGAFLEERSRRLSVLTKGEVELVLSQENTPDGLILSVTCADSGPGFNHADVCQRPVVEDVVLPYGRGLALIASLASSIEFNPEGNRLHVRLAIASNEEQPS